MLAYPDSGTMQKVIIFQPCHVKAVGTASVSNVVVDTCSWLLFCRACNAVEPLSPPPRPSFNVMSDFVPCVQYCCAVQHSCVIMLMLPQRRPPRLCGGGAINLCRNGAEHAPKVPRILRVALVRPCMHDGTQVVELLLSPPPQRTHDCHA